MERSMTSEGQRALVWFSAIVSTVLVAPFTAETVASRRMVET
jgi:hypothetical protein